MILRNLRWATAALALAFVLVVQPVFLFGEVRAGLVVAIVLHRDDQLELGHAVHLLGRGKGNVLDEPALVLDRGFAVGGLVGVERRIGGGIEADPAVDIAADV